MKSHMRRPGYGEERETFRVYGQSTQIERILLIKHKSLKNYMKKDIFCRQEENQIEIIKNSYTN